MEELLKQKALKDGMADHRRARELYKYFVPPGSTFSSAQSTFPDTVLTAHAQLVAWRLNCQRAMVSLIDRHVQYFVAESSKTLQLDDSLKYEDPSDALWAGCINVPKAGRLCEHTIQTMPTPTDPAYFEVLDLTKDDRFNTLPFVTQEPFFKYYCGVPLRTKNGIAIGSLFALDDKTRGPISRSNKIFMATMAENVMSHYENMKEKEDRKRVLNMNMCLSAFVDPEHSIKKRKRTSNHHPSPNLRGKDSMSHSVIDSVHKPLQSFKGHGRVESQETQGSRRSQRPTESDNSDSVDTPHRQRFDDDDHNIVTFRRAADLLHASLSLEGGGGVLFLDSATSSYHSTSNLADTASVSSENDSEADSKFSPRSSLGGSKRLPNKSWNPPRHTEPPGGVPLIPSRAAVLACTTTALSRDITPLSHDDLARLIKRHPRGKLFNLDRDGWLGPTSSSDEQHTYNIPKSTRITPSQKEASLLFHHFPESKQLIFLPLWDSASSKFSALFAYSTTEFRNLTTNPDFLFCIAFCNCVMTEVSRLATLAADQQKSDFIGSISHELRSPLHGILASCEFLGDTEMSSFQKSLVDTADSCARTLLDTINMVLDYSKINAFERSASKAKRQGRNLQSSLQDSTGQPQLNIYADVDLASITEEVVEGVATGQIFKDSLTGFDTIDLPTERPGQSFGGRKDVDIIIDIAPRDSAKDWTFVTQPGAFRRIIMNIFGNALKYTRTGSIQVKLEAQSPPKRPGQDDERKPVTIVKLTITDTGQGMSPQFMRTGLYTPFAQENSIAPGTGLGLSLVKSMVSMLDGEINIQSVLGVGTEVIVTFPMSPSSQGSANGMTSGSTPTSAGSIERVKDNSLPVVQEKVHGHRAMLFPDHSTKVGHPAAQMIRDAVSSYLSGWFGFTVDQHWTSPVLPNLIVTDENDLTELLNFIPDVLDHPDGPIVVVLCSAETRRAENNIPKSPNLEAVSYPFGPYKLAKSIRLCLEKAERSATMEVGKETVASAAAGEASRDSGVEDVISAVEQMTITSPDPGVPNINVIQSGKVMAHGDSVHAGILGESSHGTSSSGGFSQDTKEYPFPIERVEDGTVSPSNLDVPDFERPLLINRRTISANMDELALRHPPMAATAMSGQGAITTSPPLETQAVLRSPRMLLVDDNNVNLRLLQTFMKKRKYTDVFSAEDGLRAVTVFQDLLSASPPRPPDIIFMDISMPVMNGFEATRRIREIEAHFREQFPSPMETPPSSLIIALTGLASGRDQSEAFTSGFDLYLVKPISFREVGRLLDNWEKSGGAVTVGVPHGPAVAGGGEASADVE